MWLRRRPPPEKRNIFYRGFNRGYDAAGARLHAADHPHGAASAVSVIVALLIVAGGRLRASRVPPASSRSRIRAICSSRSSCRTALRSNAPRRRWSRSPRSRRRRRASIRSSPSRASRRWTTRRRSPMPASPTSCSSRGASAGAGSAPLFIGTEQGDGAGERRACWWFHRRRSRASAMPAGSTMQIELRDGSIDFRKLQGVANAMVGGRSRKSSFQRVSTTFRADAPQYRVDVDRVKAQTLQVTVDQVFSTLPTISARPTSPSSTGSAAPSRSMCRRTRDSACARRHQRPNVRNSQRQDDPARHAGDHRAHHRPAADQPLQSLSGRERDRPAGAGRLTRGRPWG